MGATDTELMAAAHRSAQAVGRHDRAGWVELFSPDGRVEDPVGSRPHVGRVALGKFFDTFIGPREITFHADVDIVCEDTVIRDLTLGIKMDDAVSMSVPAIVRYLVRDDAGELKIAELQAFWELPPMIWQFVRNGLAAAPAGLALSRGLLGNQGLRGTLGFLGALRRPGNRHRDALVAAITALSVGDDLAVRRCLNACEVTVDRTELAQRLRGASWGKIIAAGRSVTASVYARDARMVLIADFDDQAVISRLRVFG